jgi:dTDP-4-dehydrorhamnose 3,5-epimerase/CDP-3, 6-dideoxy-D-glycero-D-glycero-4-hexulose-5-epimerase
MDIFETSLEGVYIIDNFYAEDDRGDFIKTYNKDFFLKNNLCDIFKESYYSII